MSPFEEVTGAQQSSDCLSLENPTQIEAALRWAREHYDTKTVDLCATRIEELRGKKETSVDFHALLWDAYCTVHAAVTVALSDAQRNRFINATRIVV